MDNEHLKFVAWRHKELYFDNKQAFIKLMSRLGWSNSEIKQMGIYIAGRKDEQNETD